MLFSKIRCCFQWARISFSRSGKLTLSDIVLNIQQFYRKKKGRNHKKHKKRRKYAQFPALLVLFVVPSLLFALVTVVGGGRRGCGSGDGWDRHAHDFPQGEFDATAVI